MIKLEDSIPYLYFGKQAYPRDFDIDKLNKKRQTQKYKVIRQLVRQQIDKLLSEQFLGTIKGSFKRYKVTSKGSWDNITDQHQIQVYKNPKSTKRLDGFLRGFIDADGDLYIIDKNISMNHRGLYSLIKKYIDPKFRILESYSGFYEQLFEMPLKIVSIVRDIHSSNNDIIQLSDLYNTQWLNDNLYSIYRDNLDYKDLLDQEIYQMIEDGLADQIFYAADSIIEKAAKKNPHLKFTSEPYSGKLYL